MNLAPELIVMLIMNILVPPCIEIVSAFLYDPQRLHSHRDTGKIVYVVVKRHYRVLFATAPHRHRRGKLQGKRVCVCA